MAKINRAKNTYEREPWWLVCLFPGTFDKSSSKDGELRCNGNKELVNWEKTRGLKLTTTVTAVHKCIYPGSQWSSLVWDPQREQVIIVLFKAGAILIRYRRRWSMSWARSTRRRGRQDQLVVLKVEMSKFYRPSEPTSTKLVRTSFVLRDFCYSL